MVSKVTTIVNGTIYTMKITQNPEGKIYKIDRQTAKVYNVHIPAGYLGYMVLVLGRVRFQPSMVRIVTITSTVDPNVDWEDYLPIYPSKKNQRTNIQLHLRSSADRWIEMDLRSYARVDTECIVPLDILKKTPERGCNLSSRASLSKLFKVYSTDARLRLVWGSLNQAYRHGRRWRRPRKKSEPLVMQLFSILIFEPLGCP